MSEWHYFPFEEPRPGGTEIYTHTDQPDLERGVAEQVALLISMYGDIEEVDIDVSGRTDIDDPTTFLTIDLGEELLEDDSVLRIGLLPMLGEVWDTRPGAYSIEQVDEEDIPIRSLVVYDAQLKITPQVQFYNSNEEVELSLIRELHEALGLLISSYLENGTSNDPPHDLSEYPCNLTGAKLDTLAYEIEGEVNLN